MDSFIVCVLGARFDLITDLAFNGHFFPFFLNSKPQYEECNIISFSQCSSITIYKWFVYYIYKQRSSMFLFKISVYLYHIYLTFDINIVNILVSHSLFYCRDTRVSTRYSGKRILLMAAVL